MSKVKDIHIALGGGFLVLFIVGLFVSIMAAILGFFTEYSIETIAGFCGKDVDFPYLAACLISLIPIIGQVCLPIAAITFILTFIL